MGRDRIFFVSVMTSPFFTLDSILSRKIMDFGYVHTFGVWVGFSGFVTRQCFCLRYIQPGTERKRLETEDVFYTFTAGIHETVFR